MYLPRTDNIKIYNLLNIFKIASLYDLLNFKLSIIIQYKRNKVWLTRLAKM